MNGATLNFLPLLVPEIQTPNWAKSPLATLTPLMLVTTTLIPLQRQSVTKSVTEKNSLQLYLYAFLSFLSTADNR